jgi:hypothetical protein
MYVIRLAHGAELAKYLSDVKKKLRKYIVWFLLMTVDGVWFGDSIY